ncbi:tetratricopeptide repeat protein [Tenacibaculum finnmarkense]|uniref:tetratricopeptide repeat protein n=1 Tax=Tenacibaculum finnmarkense TaxID=2781243 RepID=UPI001E2F983B|nr:tetratricopeptide repeat protein [Tenacibaculum finnmarkense]MCD8408953.1 tetratricopeptide repeat protein [Tenacibaculum finnmarkense genomovar ulcerans]MCD8431765.1 tetratricopeptide repeat protein [Tenacibaculum finnmarkense genomovar ulcerans]MCG8733082.1 tetratricopeptide repeat protein [Tenacibaculum finnmarkense]MCG8802436.1 tetratricopeptide repeat protein [Tenacibaculum finnmarkense]MCG8807240.1 tetratricopeptide repeat protein [Tenacibaculum finnmarkense]
MKKAVILFNILIFSLFCNVQLHAQQNEFIVAENYFRNNDYQKAVHLYKKLHNKSPYNSLYLKRLVTSYQETNQFLVADALLSERIKEKPNLVFLNIIKGYNFERQQKDIQANKEYQIALNSLDKKRNYGATIARLFKEYNKLDFAIEAYTKIITNNPKANYGFQLAQLYGEKGNFKKMFDSYVSLVDKDEKYLNNVKRYTSKYINENPENENNILFKKALLRKAVSNPKNCWNDLLSWLFITQKQYSKALIQQKALVARNPDYLNKIHQLGEISLENKDYETAKNCFDFIIEKTNYPTDKFKAINNNLKIAIRTKQADIPEKFQAIFNEYGINKNTFELQIAYANYLTFTENTPEKAIKILQKALTFANSKFEKAAIKLKLGEVLVYTNNFNKALIYFSQVQTQFKNHFLGQEARFKVAQTSYFKNDFTWAKAQLKILKGSATQLIANDAANLFLTITDNQPKDSVSTGLKQYAKADLLAFQNKDTQAISILTNLITNYKGQPIQDEALFKQAGLFIKQQKYEAAIFNYNKIIALDKNGIYVDDVYYQMAELYRTKLNNPEKAKKHYQKIIFDHASSIYLIDARKQFRQLRKDQL